VVLDSEPGVAPADGNIVSRLLVEVEPSDEPLLAPTEPRAAIVCCSQ
jgi:hypothetical protein